MKRLFVALMLCLVIIAGLNSCEKYYDCRCYIEFTDGTSGNALYSREYCKQYKIKSCEDIEIESFSSYAPIKRYRCHKSIYRMQ